MQNPVSSTKFWLNERENAVVCTGRCREAVLRCKGHFLKILLSEERTGGFCPHLYNVLRVHCPVFRAEQLKAGRTVIADRLDRVRDLLHRDRAQAGHQAVAVVEDAEREILAVVDVEYKQ